MQAFVCMDCCRCSLSGNGVVKVFRFVIGLLGEGIQAQSRYGHAKRKAKKHSEQCREVQFGVHIRFVVELRLQVLLAMTSALLGSRSSTPFTLSAGLKEGLKRGGRGEDFFGSGASKERKWGFFQKNERIADVQK